MKLEIEAENETGNCYMNNNPKLKMKKIQCLSAYVNSNTKNLLKTLAVGLTKIRSGGPITKIQPKNEIK